jgi:hypothetical protein
VILPSAQNGQETPPGKDAKQDVADEKTVRASIAELADDSFDKREAAQQKLSAIGAPALKALMKAAQETRDAEIRERLTRLIRDMQDTGLPSVRSEFYHDFRNSRSFAENFYLNGPEATRRVKPEPKGLRVTLAAEESFKYDGVGVAAKFGIRGDFEITVGFEMIAAGPPVDGPGVYFELYLMIDSVSNDALAFNRMVLPDGKEVYASARMANLPGGGRGGIAQGDDVPASAKSGQLRVTRLGRKVVLSVREGNERFRVLHQLDLGPEDVKFLRLGANPGGGPHAVDVRILDLRVRGASPEAIQPLAKMTAKLGPKLAPATAKKDTGDEKAIRGLVAQLGDESFAKRDAAEKRLLAIGTPALAPLRKAAKDGASLETRTRAADLVRAIGKSLVLEVRRFEGHAEEPQRMATRVVVSPDGRRAVSSGSGMLRQWDLDSGQQLLAFGPIAAPNYWVMRLSTDGKRVLAGGHDNNARIFDLATGKQLQEFVGHTALLTGAALLPDGKRAITAAYDRSIRVWDAQTGKEIRILEKTGQMVRCLAVAPDGKTLAAADFPSTSERGGKVRLWDSDTGKLIRTMDGNTTAINTVSFSPDGKTVLDGTLRLWEVASGKELKPFKDRPEGVRYAVFTPDGRRILTGGDNPHSVLRVWDLASGDLVFETEPFGDGILCVAALPDNQSCLTATRDGVVRLWQLER